MKSRNSGLFVIVSALGVAICVVAMLGFVFTIENNNLAWNDTSNARDHYTAVSDSWSQGFLIGFFLCLFLVMGAVSLRTWAFGKVDQYYARREQFRAARARTTPPPTV